VSKAPLPPSIADKVRDHGARGGRVRVELGPPTAKWLLGLINESMAGLDIEDAEFRNRYLLYRSIADQIDRLEKS